MAASYDIIGHYRDFEFAMLLPLKGENECREFVEVFQKFVADSIDAGDNSDAIKMISGIVTADSGMDNSLDYESFVRAAVQAKQANKQRKSLCTSARQLHWEELRHQAETHANADDLDVMTSLWKKLYEESMHLQFDKSYWTQAAQRYAECLVKAGRYAQVVPILSDLLCVRTDELGPDDMTTIGTAGELAHCYYAQGKYDDAEWLSQGVLSAYSKHYGTDFPLVATWHYNVGSLYYVQQNYAAAEPHYKKALDIRKKILGTEHADTRKSQSSYDALQKVLNPTAKNTEDTDREMQLITGSWTVYRVENDESIS
jgi:tetratricopeptide (TPR) repeat protein